MMFSLILSNTENKAYNETFLRLVLIMNMISFELNVQSLSEGSHWLLSFSTSIRLT